MANYWSSRGVRVTLITYASPEDKPFFPLHPEIDRIPLSANWVTKNIFQAVSCNLRRIWAVRQAIRKSGASAVISFMDATNVVVLISSLGLGIPVIVSERTNPFLHSPGKSWELLRRWFYPMASSVVVLNQRCAEYFDRQPSLKIKNITNPVMSRPGMKDAGAGRKNQFLAVGRLSSEKGYDLLIRAFHLIESEIPEWTLVVFGEGVLRETLEKLVSSLNLSGRVHLPGVIQNPESAMLEASIFVLASRFEGFPNALCEAMACGMAVIATDCSTGPREIITDKVDGCLVPIENVGALAAAMLRLAKDPVEREGYASQAPGVKVRFSLESVMAKWESILPGDFN